MEVEARVEMPLTVKAVADAKPKVVCPVTFRVPERIAEAR
jgi:hypothetical protein